MIDRKKQIYSVIEQHFLSIKREFKYFFFNGSGAEEKRKKERFEMRRIDKDRVIKYC